MFEVKIYIETSLKGPLRAGEGGRLVRSSSRISKERWRNRDERRFRP